MTPQNLGPLHAYGREWTFSASAEFCYCCCEPRLLAACLLQKHFHTMVCGMPSFRYTALVEPLPSRGPFCGVVTTKIRSSRKSPTRKQSFCSAPRQDEAAIDRVRSCGSHVGVKCTRACLTATYRERSCEPHVGVDTGLVESLITL
jgi:hypothetical protein